MHEGRHAHLLAESAAYHGTRMLMQHDGPRLTYGTQTKPTKLRLYMSSNRYCIGTVPVHQLYRYRRNSLEGHAGLCVE